MTTQYVTTMPTMTTGIEDSTAVLVEDIPSVEPRTSAETDYHNGLGRVLGLQGDMHVSATLTNSLAYKLHELADVVFIDTGDFCDSPILTRKAASSAPTSDHKLQVLTPYTLHQFRTMLSELGSSLSPNSVVVVGPLAPLFDDAMTREEGKAILSQCLAHLRHLTTSLRLFTMLASGKVDEFSVLDQKDVNLLIEANTDALYTV